MIDLIQKTLHSTRPMVAANPADHLDWLRAFRARHGRPPAVLHIGNIANNAYVLSKALNGLGIDSDVVVPDDYHIMTCPEWEEADFDGLVGDHFYPAWEQVNLNGFARPPWFVQGPTRSCLNYLLARRSGNAKRIQHRWNVLEAKRRKHCAVMRDAQKAGVGKSLSRLQFRARRYAERILHGFQSSLRRMLPWAKKSMTFPERVSALNVKIHEVLPDVQETLSTSDFPVTASAFHDLWQEVLSSYDLIMGYSIDGMFPLVSNRPYFAFEHGTIRSIPFEPTPQGRLCGTTYRMALHSFITNADNDVAARKLGLTSYNFLPHPVNEQTTSESEVSALRQELCERLKTDFIVLHPARQHWTAERHPSWEKGNDVFIEGFAGFVREKCPTASAIFVNWGNTVDASRALLRDLGVADRVLWIEPQVNRRLLALMSAADAVADQFFLGSFGSIVPRVLRLGRPCLLALDEARHRWCFPQMPPVLNVHTPHEVQVGLTRLYYDREFAEGFTTDGPRWYNTYHSMKVVTDRFLDEFRKVVG